MNFDRIVGFGDSWMFGDELIDPDLLSEHPEAHYSWYQNKAYRQRHCFLGLLGQHYAVPVENFGQSGGSHQSAAWAFLSWIARQTDQSLSKTLVLVAHTDNNRTSFYNPLYDPRKNLPEWQRWVHSTWINADDSVLEPHWKNMIKHHMAYSDCQDLSHLNYMQSVLLFDGVASRRGLPVIQFDIMDNGLTLSVPTMIWPGTNLVRWFLDHPDNQDRRYYCADGHPNELGHELIRDRLIIEIDRVILSE